MPPRHLVQHRLFREGVGLARAAHQITGATLGSTYQYAATYDALLRLTDVQLTRLSDSTQLFEENRGFDAGGNVTTLATTLPQGTDTQQFCYDEQNRLTWAGAADTPTCTGTAITPGTLTAAQYPQTFSYDPMGRLTSGPLGSYTNGDSAHAHAATAIGSSGSPDWTASCDASANMTCRRLRPHSRSTRPPPINS